MTWASDLRAGMMTEEAVRDAASAQALKTEHDRLKAEVEAREENFTGLVQMADTMIQDGHYASQVRTLVTLFHVSGHYATPHVWVLQTGRTLGAQVNTPRTTH